jgi:hypothetical protein
MTNVVFCVVCAFRALCVPPVPSRRTPAGYDAITEVRWSLVLLGMTQRIAAVPYSLRNTSTGFTFVALRAGI